MVATVDLVLVFAYILLCLIIGFVASRRETSADFLIGSRHLGLFRFTATFVASAVGGGTLVAYTAFVYRYGISAAWAWLAYCLMIAAFTWYGLRLRAASKKENWHTLPDFFFSKHGHGVGIIVSLLILLTSFLYLVGQLIAGSTVLSVTTEWPYWLSLVIAAGVVLTYLLLGGFNAVVATDVFQYLLMFFLTIVIGTSFARGVTFLPEQLELFGAGPALVIGLILFGILSVIVSPEIWQRIYAARDDSVLKRGMPLSALLILIITAGLTLIVMAVRSRFADIVPEQALAYGFVHVLPSIALGFGLVLLFATIMSSADTIIFVLATIASKNILRHHEKLPPAQLMRVTRAAIAGVTVTAALFAYMFPNIINIYTVIANVVFSIAPATIASFHWKLKRRAIYLSIGAGIVTLLAFLALGLLKPEVAALGFVASLLALGVGQLVFRK